VSLASKRLIGAAAILGAVLIAIAGITQPSPFAQTQTYWAQFDSAQGLGAIGRDVRVGGVNVGSIGRVERVGDDALVELTLTEDIPIRADARADMRPHTLFEGSSFIDLFPGSPSAPLLGTDEAIPNTQTSNYVTLDEAFRVLRPEIRRYLRDLAATGSKTLRGAAVEGIQRTVGNAPELTRHLKGPARALQGRRGDELSGAIDGMAKTVDGVAQREADLIPLAGRLDRTATAVTVDGAEPLDATLAALPGALRELEEGAPELTELVDRLDRLAAEVNPALPQFTTALERGTPLLRRTIPVLRETTPIIVDLRKISARITAAVPTLADLVETVDPLTAVFGESVLPVLLGPSRTGPATYEQLLAMFSAADAVFRPYQTESQNPAGYGHLWNLATYVSPGGEPPLSGGQAALACDKVREVSARAARELAAAGGCR
jgi:phospholipid/cholesterol/gamma-HCH transport system substrate-binding protein